MSNLDPDPLALARQIAESYRDPDAELPQRPKRPRKRRPLRGSREDPLDIANVVDSLVEEQGWSEQLANTRVFTDFAAIVGTDIAAHAIVEQFSDAVVHLRASSTAWAKELKLLAPRLVERLNDELGDGSVVRIEVRGPSAPSWSSGARRVRGARGPRDTYG